MDRPLPFTEEEMQKIFDTNLIQYAISQGFEAKKADRKSYHIKGYGGLYLFEKGYKHFSRGESGNIIDFAREYQGLSFIDAVERILGTRAYTNTLPSLPTTAERGELVLPKRSEDQTKAIHYLTEERCLDKEIVARLMEQGYIYQATTTTKDKGAVFQNCAFISFNNKGKARYCSLRGMGGSKFRQDVVNSDKSYGFTIQGTGNRIFCFESPVDAISHATLFKLNGLDETADYRISEGCLSNKALSRFLSENPQIIEIVFCFDNDIDGKDHKGKPHNHGQEYAKKCIEKYRALGYAVYIQAPERKDFNADLQYIHKSVIKQLKERQSVIPKAENDSKRKNYER